MIGINGTASTSTRIRLYTSSDNSSWTLQIDNNALGNVLQYEEILYEYSTLYVRVNMTTTDKTKTPYLDELFYYHVSSGGGGSPPVVSDSDEWFSGVIFIGIPLILVAYYMSNRRKI
jgi:hypothetical protein